MKTLQIIFGILMIIGLSLGIGFGVYRTHDGKNLRDFAGMYAEMREELHAAKAAARAAQIELAHYKEYFGKLEAP